MGVFQGEETGDTLERENLQPCYQSVFFSAPHQLQPEYKALH